MIALLRRHLLFRSTATLASLLTTTPIVTKATVGATTTTMTESCSASINDVMPALGFGCFMLPRDQVEPALRSALPLGYRRLDNAAVYFNEDAVGDALQAILQDSIVARDELFVVSKLASPFHRHVEQACRKTLSDLRLDYLDLYLIHWPVAFQYIDGHLDTNIRGYINEDIDDSGNGARIDATVSVHDTWRQMEALVDRGLVRYIGVSNFPVALLHELRSTARIKPAVNQCELHPYLPQPNLVKYCATHGIALQAYAPLGSPGFHESDEPSVLQDEVLHSIAKRRNCTTAQVALAWAWQRGTSVVVKSASPQHQHDNWQARDMTLTLHEMAQIDAISTRHRYFRPEEWWPDYAMAVFD